MCLLILRIAVSTANNPHRTNLLTKFLHYEVFKVQAALARQLIYITTTGQYCQALFSTFFKVIFQCPSAAHQRQLDYITTPTIRSQVLFSTFFMTFFTDFFHNCTERHVSRSFCRPSVTYSTTAITLYTEKKKYTALAPAASRIMPPRRLHTMTLRLLLTA